MGIEAFSHVVEKEFSSAKCRVDLQILYYSRTPLSRTSLSQIFCSPGRFFEIFSSYIEIDLTIPDFEGFRTG